MPVLCFNRVGRRCGGVCAVRVLVYPGVVLLCVGLGVRLVGTGGNTSSRQSSRGSGGREQGLSHAAESSLGSNTHSQNLQYQAPQDPKAQEESSQESEPQRSTYRHRHPQHSITQNLQYQKYPQGADVSLSATTRYHNPQRRGRKTGRMADTEGRNADFNGKWKMAKSENFEEFLAANGANWFMRKMASKVSPAVDITQDGDKFCIKTVTPVRTQEDSFTVGTPYEHASMGGTQMKVTPSWDGEALLLANEPKEAGKGKPSAIRREIVDGQLILTMKVDDVVCKRWFDKV